MTSSWPMATGSAGQATKRPRVSSVNSTSDRRRFVPAWKSEFPWVVAGEGVMRCQYCVDARKRNIFATMGCDKFKKDALKKTCWHQRSPSSIGGKVREERHAVRVATAYRHQEQAVRAALRTIFFMAKKNLPNDMFSDLKQFQVLQVSAFLKLNCVCMLFPRVCMYMTIYVISPVTVE